MRIGVTISMDNQNTLVTVAMLSALLCCDKKDYIELIKPFILRLLPKHVGDVVDKSEIKKALSRDYGLVDFPIHVQSYVLNRCSKTKEGYLRRENGNYYVSKIFDDSDFDEKQSKIRISTNLVLDALVIYLNEYTSIKCKDINDAQRRLILFLNTYGYLLINDIDELRDIKINIDQNNYHIARFILEQRSSNPTIFSEIIEIVKGYLVYKAIYFFSTEQKRDVLSKMKDTIFIFDTRQLINALGYNRKEDSMACRELIDLIYENKGHVCTFPHIVSEVYGILTKFAYDKDSRNSFDLELLIANRYEEVDVLRLRDTLAVNLQQLRIDIVEPPSYGRVSSEDKDLESRGFIDLDDLKKSLTQNYHLIGINPKDNPLDHDIESISAVSRMRGKERACTLENCKAIFVTANLIIVKTIQDHYRQRWLKGEIPFSISEMDLTAVIWLKSFDKKTDLPCLKLMENAYAACTPSKSLLIAFSDKIRLLEQEDKISNEAALILRSQREFGDDLVELTENNPAAVTSDVIFEIKKRYEESILQEERKKLSAIISDQSDELCKSGEASKRIADQDARLRQVLKARKSKALEDADFDSKRESEKYRRKLIFGGKILSGVLSLIFIVSSLSTLYSFIDTKNYIWLLAIIPSLLISILSGMTFLKSGIWLFSKIINKKVNMKFDIILEIRTREIEKYYSDLD